MPFEETPKVRIELESIRLGVMHCLTDYNGDFERLVNERISECLSEDWIIGQIDDAVRGCIRKAIDNVSNNHHVQRATT